MRAFVCVVVAALSVAACSAKKTDDSASGAEAESPAPDDGRAAIAPVIDRLAADPVSYERPPLTRPGADVPSVDDAYAKARRVARGVLAPQAHTPDAVFAVARRWESAPKTLRALGKDARSGEVATLVAAGAAGPSGQTAGDAETWGGVGSVVVAYGLERELAGEPADAAWTLLTAAWLGYDVTRGRRLFEAKYALNLVRGALAGLRAVVERATRKSLPDDELTALLDGCRALMAARPLFADALLADTRWHEAALAAIYGDGERPADVTERVEADLRRMADKSGGVAKLADRLAQQRVLADRLRAMKDATGRERQTRAEHERDRIWGKGHPWSSLEDVGRFEQANAELAGTCFLIARELETRGAKPEGEPIADPVSGKPWQVDGSVIRGGELNLHGKTRAIELLLLPNER